MEVDIEIAKEAFYWRGLFISRYAAVEFAIAELVSRGRLHPSYTQLGDPPFGPVKKLRRLTKMIETSGPIAAYRPDVSPMLDEFHRYAEHRNFMVHAIMVPRNHTRVEFKMYDHRAGNYSVGELVLEMKHMQAIAEQISSVSIEFTRLVAKMCREIPLPLV